MNKLYIAMYHYTRDLRNSRYPKIKALDLPLFRRQLDFFEENFHVVTMESVLEAVYGGGKLPENAVLLTFDDGYMDNYTVAMPLLRQRHMQGSFFIPGKTIAENVLLDVNKIHFILASADVHLVLKDLLDRMNYYRNKEFSFPENEELYEKYAVATRFDGKETIFIKRMLQTVLPEQLRDRISSELFKKYLGLPEDIFARELYVNRTQIQFMKSVGMFIGFHGYGHSWLADLPEEEMRQDIDKGLEVMDEFINPDGWIMNYPYGSYNDAVCRYVQERGGILGLTTDVRVVQLGQDAPMALPRLDCNDFPPKSDNWKTLGGYKRMRAFWRDRIESGYKVVNV